jgi:hypothetical protein
MLEEEIFLGLRKMSKGLDIFENINRKFGIDFKEKYSKMLIDKYQKFRVI